MHLLLDWTNTDFGLDPFEEGMTADLMPLVIQYLTPTAVSVIGNVHSTLHVKLIDSPIIT